MRSVYSFSYYTSETKCKIIFLSSKKLQNLKTFLCLLTMVRPYKLIYDKFLKYDAVVFPNLQLQWHTHQGINFALWSLRVLQLSTINYYYYNY